MTASSDQTAFVSSRPLPRSYGSHLYRRGTIYYFRLALSPEERQHLGKAELRISLRTGYRKEAADLAQKLFTICRPGLEEPMKNYDHLKNLPRLVTVLSARMLQASFSKGKEADDVYAPLFPDVTLSEVIEDDIQKIEQILQEDGKNAVCAGEKWDQNGNATILMFLIAMGYFSQKEITPYNVSIIINEFYKAQSELFKVRNEHEKGNFYTELEFHLSNTVPARSVENKPKEIPSKKELRAYANEPEAELKQNHGDMKSEKDINQAKKPLSKAEMPYSKAIKTYVEDKISTNTWKEKGIVGHTQRLNQFIEVIGDKPVSAISCDDMRSFVERYKKLPANRSKSAKYKGKTVDEILQMDIDKPMSTDTVNLTIQEINAFFEWCIVEEYIDKNPASKLQIKKKTVEINERMPFEDSDIQAIFDPTTFTPEKFKNPSEFWAPLIAVYTGMRLEEICQLYCSDIHTDKNSGIWVIDINAKLNKDNEQDKTTKTETAVRLIPLHPDLVKLGLLKFRDEVESLGYERLFPELRKSSGNKSYGHNVGQNFGRYLDRHPQDFDKKLTFHSFRHTFSQKFKERETYTTPNSSSCSDTNPQNWRQVVMGVRLLRLNVWN